MRGVVIFNPAAGAGGRREDLARLEHEGLIVETLGPGRGAEALARAALDAGAPLVVAAGGDGTIHDVAGAMLASGKDATLAIVPLGTGNDLARGLRLPLDPALAIDVVLGGDDRRIDVIAGESPEGPVHALNAASCGLSSEIARHVTGQVKARWGPFAYFIGMLEAIPDVGTEPFEVTWEDGTADVLDAVNVIVANGSSVAGGRVVAPDASLEDGLMDVVIVRRRSRWQLARLVATLALGPAAASGSSPLLVRRARALTLHSGRHGAFNLDGDIVTRTQLRLVVRPRALRVRVGADYASSARA